MLYFSATVETAVTVQKNQQEPVQGVIKDEHVWAMREDITMFDKRFFQQLVGTDDNQHTGAKVKAEDVCHQEFGACEW